MTGGETILWGFVATLVLTTIMHLARPMGFTRMDIPFLLGTMFTGSRDRAPILGFACHLVMGFLFALLYTAAMNSADIHTWWFGMLTGALHGAFVLAVGLPLLSGWHPRMASPYRGPTPTRQLEPPGFFALNYGKGTPVVTLLAHMVYGIILGGFH